MFVGWLLLAISGVAYFVQVVFLLGMLVTFVWLLLRAFRVVAEKAVWRLRHRLIITYLFIAVAPVLLLASLVVFAIYSLMLQVAMNTVTAELEHRSLELSTAADAISKLSPSTRGRDMARLLDPYFTQRFQGVAAVLRQGGQAVRFPESAEAPASAATPGTVHGLVQRSGNFFLWAQSKTSDAEVSLAAPLTHELLDQLTPELGLVDVASDIRQLGGPRSGILPKASGRFDPAFFWFATLRSGTWDNPAELSQDVTIALETRRSAVIANIFNRNADIAQGIIRAVFIAGAIIFLVVEIICWVIGVNMTRTITGAVHYLYEGTQKVMDGEFSHRMIVSGHDQLAEVGSSFNRMTAHLEQLVTVAKEKERMQSELQIAREVQNQLYPHLETSSSHLRIAAMCHPARVVSGDYFDYKSVGERQVAIAIGDVSGKGISAALLMASLQSSLRTQLQSFSENTKLSTAEIVRRVNQHLCASTSPDKYATFFLGLYDETSSTLSYTNAGHLPPVLVRKGCAHRLDVNGTVVGAFVGVPYDESRIVLEPGDLLAWFTDGLTEPESEFGEMFGEERFIDLLTKNAHRDEQRIVDLVLEAVRHWTNSDAMQDDITLLLARRA
jgi:sigma-B regulation protein RsbU (phosphoserine phosphatase)